MWELLLTNFDPRRTTRAGLISKRPVFIFLATDY